MIINLNILFLMPKNKEIFYAHKKGIKFIISFFDQVQQVIKSTVSPMIDLLKTINFFLKN